ncbi:MAG: hypothetical protein D3910_03255, partial [Candidatus Electrothrix sp. ATG2]|nr:hypothetical protein [Candidatus Electrothrix sp. ATG2]
MSIIGVGLLILLIILFWNRRLQQEIVRRHRVEQDLMQSREAAETALAMIESSEDCFYQLDLDDDMRMIGVNAATVQHFGCSKETILTRHLPDWDLNFDRDQAKQLKTEIKKYGK